MVGPASESLVFPVMDLIKRQVESEMAKALDQDQGDSGVAGQKLIQEIPSITLTRNHPNDSTKVVVTSVEMKYEAGFTFDVRLVRGALNNPYILDSIIINGFDDRKGAGDKFMSYIIKLNYDSRGLLMSTLVNKILKQDAVLLVE